MDTTKPRIDKDIDGIVCELAQRTRCGQENLKRYEVGLVHSEVQMIADEQWQGVVVDIVPVSVHQGKTYTQDVRIELEDGSEATVHDGKKICDEELIGKKVQFEVIVNTFNDVKKGGDKKAIVPVPQNQGPYATITGEVVKMGGTGLSSLVVVDFGIGTIEMDLGKTLLSKFQGVSEHDTIMLDGASLHLNDIELKR